jgi:pyruvate dehydrogenase E2 component (dihydrolipoamide acetyltransferase)
MAVDITMPQLGLTMTKGTIIEWLNKEGDEIEKGRPLFVVENDKSTVEIEAPADGLLAQILIPEDQEVEVGTVVGILTASGEEAVKAAPMEAAAIREPAAETGGSQRDDGFILASPRARALAKERGIDLSMLQGSGPEKSVVESDVLAVGDFVGGPAGGPADRSRERWEGTPAGVSEIRSLSRVQVKGAAKMVESWSTIPQFTLQRETDARAAVDVYQYTKGQGEEKIPLNILLVKAIARAVKDYPLLNSRLVEEDKVEVFHRVNVGVAMDSERGLLVPVLKDAAGRSLVELAREWNEIVFRIKAGSDTPNDYAEATISVSNLGMYGVKSFRAVVVPPQVAILSLGAIIDGPSGEKKMEMGITADHRVVDGAYAAKFLERAAALIRQPAAIFL